MCIIAVVSTPICYGTTILCYLHCDVQDFAMDGNCGEASSARLLLDASTPLARRGQSKPLPISLRPG